MSGDIIRSLRKQAGLSQEDLADGICSAVSISCIEKDAHEVKSIISQNRLFEAKQAAIKLTKNDFNT